LLGFLDSKHFVKIKLNIKANLTGNLEAGYNCGNFDRSAHDKNHHAHISWIL
jgi:hypothetical protein